MRKKQIRITGADQIKSRITEFVKHNITVVLDDNTTLFGELEGLEGNELLIRNTRQKKIKIPLERIIDLFTDMDA